MSDCKQCKLYKEANVNILLKNNELFLRVNELAEENEALKAFLNRLVQSGHIWPQWENDYKDFKTDLELNK